MPQAWFGPKRKGFGVRPASWPGWLVCLAFVAVMITLSIVFHPSRSEGFWRFGVATAVTLVVFGAIVAATFQRSGDG